MTYINFAKRIFDGTGSDDSIEGAVIRVGGKHITNTITLNANNTTAYVNVFQVTGTLDIKALHGELVAKTTLTNMTNIHFDLYDGTNSILLTKATGANMSGFNVGSFIIKNSNASTELTTINNNQARVTEGGTGTKSFQEFLVTQKEATNTYIRFIYSTTDAPINAQVAIHLNYADIDNGTITAV